MLYVREVRVSGARRVCYPHAFLLARPTAPGDCVRKDLVTIACAHERFCCRYSDRHVSSVNTRQTVGTATHNKKQAAKATRHWPTNSKRCLKQNKGRSSISRSPTSPGNPDAPITRAFTGTMQRAVRQHLRCTLHLQSVPISVCRRFRLSV